MGSWMMKALGALLCLASANSLGSVLEATDVVANDYAITANLKFDKPIDDNSIKIEYINQTVQIDIPGAAVPKGKSLTRVSSDKIKSVFAYQVEPDLMRARVIYEKPIQANMFEGFVHVASSGTELKITIEDPQSKMSKATKEPETITLMPPVDLNSELEPKKKATIDEKTAAAAVLEKEFLSKIEKFDKNPIPKVEANIESEKTERIESPKGKAAEKYDEKRIPLNLDKSGEKAAAAESPWTRMLISLFVIAILGVGAIIFAKKYSKNKSGVGGNIRIQTVSQQALGPKKSLAVIRVAGEDILIGITDYNISMIKSLSFIDDEVESDVPKEFVSELNRVTDDYISNKQRARSAAAQAQSTPPSKEQAGDQYSFANIKDIVSDRLKEMRPL